ncbi:uncharacterized protein fndc7rs1 [Danio aesculapii]|uniref:uncharacterized protein fndc7rs1 n=1 Tax=Danio aesculapii TaxID=1142201 RepID=UPI0024C09648|nr:uncharacterized protein fndc7rs1 [Danio aesculapii]
MHLPRTLCFFITLFSLTQVKEAIADCNITSTSSPTASSLYVKWSTFPGATNYNLELRPVNSSIVAPISVPPLASTTVEKLVQGLRPGQIYQVIFKVYVFSYMTCINSQIAQTIPATSQITYLKAISSTSIKFEWSSAQGADKYILIVEGTFTNEFYNLTFTKLSGQIGNLQRSTSYNCYVYSANAAGIGAKSLVKTIRTLVQPPDGVNVTGLTRTTARVTWQAVSGVLLYQVSVSSNNMPVPALKNVTSTAADISNLEPCTTYTIGVSSYNMFLEAGEANNVTYTTITISTVSSISVDYSCNTATASVSWNAVTGATLYRAIITDSKGQSLNCTSTDTNCQIVSVPCGELYSVWIKAIASCESTSDGSYVFETAPCPPKSPTLYRECSTNAIVFSWNPTNKTAYYLATAVDSDGQVTECLTVDTSCYFTDTVCAKGYSFYVSSTYIGGLDCNSGNSQAKMIRTAPCLPQNVHTTADCNSISTAVTSWDMADGAETYMVEARGNSRDFYNCTSQNSSCTLTDLDCGESLSVWLIATDGECTTDPVLGEVAETVPCIPQNVSAGEKCSSNSATLSWLGSNGAIFYYGTAKHADGTVYSCTALKTECIFDSLKCGETYDAYVVATNLVCNSSDSQHVTLKTAPCAPAGVGLTTDYASNYTTVSWQTLQSGGLYTAILQDEYGSSMTCSTSFNNCTLAKLLCGVKYNLSVTMNDGHCKSLPSTAIQIHPAPCSNTGIQARLDCGTNSALVSWTPGNGALSFNVTLQSFQDSQLHSCLTNGSSCNISSLQCGQRYSISVTGNGQAGTSVSTPMATVDTAPCAPTQVNVSLAHGSDTASVSWAASSGFVSYYVVTAEYDNGRALTCNSSSTSCNISGLACSEAYNVSVTAMSANCTGQRSEVRHINTALCAPQNVSANVSCSSNIATVTWGRSRKAAIYSVTASSASGLSINCTSASTSCDLLALTCGESYTITVKAGGSNCSSVQSTPVQIQTAPCPPLNIHSTMNFDNKTASVSWSPGNGALSFIMTMQCFPGQTYTCMTSQMTCDITNMTCGQACPVQVVAVGQSCNSSVQTGPPIATAPCVNTDIQATLDCGTNSALVSWTPGNGALSVNVTLQSFQDSQLHSCLTNGSSCNISSLQCGQRYSISVTGNGQAGTSVSTPMATVDTAPCAPTQVNVSLAHGSDTASVSWAASSGFVSYYVVTAEYDNGRALTCNSSSTSCNISGLACSEAYNVSVTAMSANCTGQRSEVRHINTALCAPQNVSANVSCSSNIATVTWGRSRKAAIYSVTASSASGLSINCTSASTSCDLLALTCGESYTITVKAGGSNCSSVQSTPVQIQTAPCPPLNIHSTMNFDNKTASVSWSPGNGALSFIMTMQCFPGQTYTCMTSQMTCDITNMTCGQACPVQVVAVGQSCNSSVQTGPPIATAPCVNTDIQATLDCGTNSALVSWTPGNGALSVNVTLQSFQDSQLHSCLTNGSSCNISSLQCGQRYSISVTGNGQAGTSVSTPMATVDTAPCAPTQVNVSLAHGSDTASVSWAASSGFVSYYVVTAEYDNGRALTCNSSSTSCNISGLACSEAYNVSVTAMSANCTGQRSEVRHINTALCAPQNVSANVSCSSNIATVTWGRSRKAAIYSVTASSASGLSINCTSASTSCDLLALTCGESYTITVKAGGSNCSSVQSTPVQIQTAPCPPLNIHSTMNFDNKTASVSWSPGNGALSFIMTMQCFPGQTYTCMTSQMTCDITNMTCGQACPVQVVAVGQSCNSSVQTGPPIATAPCLNTDIQATLDCGTNSALVSWTPGNGALSVNVTLQSFQDSQLHSCLTNGSSCNISSLQCGQRYSISVTGNGQAGTSVSTPMATVDTAPCAPTQVNVSLAHGSDIASVSWAASSGFVSYYVVTAEYDNGRALTCNSSSTSCNISGLACSEAYNVSITAMSANCTGQRSEVRHINTVLCAPQNVSANVSFSSNIATVTWGRSRKAAIYSVTASSASGLSINCTSASTSCDLLALTCGESYTITVKAGGSNCSSVQSTPVQIQTAPCPPLNIHSTMNFDNKTASVSWSPGNGALFFIMTMQCFPGQTYTCMTSQMTCDITNMTCGQACPVQVVAVGQSCNSSVQTGPPIATAPCLNTDIQATLDCGTNSALVSWTPGNGALSVNVTLQSFQDSQLHSCLTNGSSCNISSLQCGQRYSISVTGNGQAGTSVSTPMATVDTAPCAPTQVNVSLAHGSDTASVSWAASSGFVSYYVVTAEYDNGRALTCNSSSTSCNISGLACSEAYNVSITAMSANCTGQRSEVRHINTALCAPQNVSANVSCMSNIATVTWGRSRKAAIYSVTASSASGLSINCTSASTSCDLLALTCGESYTITVKAGGSNCSSVQSTPVQIQTAPCPPLNIHSTMNFDNKTASVSWSPGNGALFFIMTMQCFPGQTYTCMTSQMTCDITNMTCGQACPVQVVAVGQSCNSSVQTGPPIATAPCLNTDIQATLDCGTNSALVSWTPGNGALSVNVTLQSFQDSQLHSCFTYGSSCNISSLQCGQRYSISVTGNGQAGTSVSTPMATVDTAPCAPTQVNVSLAHGSDTASVSWAASSGFVSYYVVTAEYENGRALTCNSSSTSCNISGLACSEAYNVSVTAMSVNCTGQRSEVRHINTALCAPQNVSVNVSCSSNIATVTWGRSRKATIYSVTASSASGLSVNCTSASTSCDLLALTCGESYTITVKAGGSNCSSAQSTPVQIQTAPCPLLNIHSTMNFDNKTASVSWSPGNGALSFIMTMQCFPGQTYTCMTSQMTCDITNMTCGQACPVQVVAVGQSCNSSVQTGPPIATAPCLNTDIQATLDCGTNSALVSWTPGNGALSVNVTLQSFQDSQLHSCLTNGSSCNISSLQCGQRYSISVTGNGQAGTSVSTPMATVDTAPCAPTQVNVSLAHGSDTASVSWAASSGFVSYYVVTAEYDNGRALTCNSSSTSCNISGLACSEAYNVSITAMSANCTGQRSEVRHINTALCAPQNVSANVSCSSNIATLTWGRSRKAAIYSVTASSASGLSINCTSASTSCDLLALTCGESYTITVKAGGSNCSSAQSTPVQIQTAPCPPLNIHSTMNFDNKTASVSWSPGNGALSFIMTMQCFPGQTYTCMTSQMTCDITNMTCGQACPVQVVAVGQSCNSSVQTGPPIATAPCLNTDIQATLDCGTNSALVSWTPGNGALSVNVTLQSFQDSQLHSCLTNGSSCNISSLQCGQRYSISVTGNGQAGTSVSTPMATVDTAPCAPTQVNVSLANGSDTASVSWAASSGFVSYYVVTAEYDNERALSCNSSSTSCNISGLACSEAYNVSVTAMSANCTGQRSEVRHINTALCAPQNVSANVSCSSSIATVTWGRSRKATIYSVTASSASGLSINCTSASTSCDLLALTCGESYTITVKAGSSNCSSEQSTPVQIQTAPCPPLNIHSTMNFDNKTASVSWSPGNGALSFIMTMQCFPGQTYTCMTSQMTCDITNMTCGQACPVQVVAVGQSCNSSVQTGPPIATAPCLNTDIQATLDCGTNSALVSWTPGNGALSVNVTLQSFQDSQLHSCLTNGSSCNISSLQCGQRYSISVTGNGQAGSSVSTPMATVDTAPCAPTQVNVSLAHGSDIASVSWAASSGFVSYYVVTAEYDNGRALTCNSSSTSCNISGLACSEAYNVSITAMSANCTGQRSEVRHINTALCAPQIVSANVSCSSNIATVTWGRSRKAAIYSVTASSASGFSINCTSASTSCDLLALTCGESYTITVKAGGSNCSSAQSTPVQIQTAPCPPLNIHSTMNFDNKTASVSWSPGNGALFFIMTMQCFPGQTYTCMTSQMTCDITNMTCGQACPVQVVAVGQSCNSSVQTGPPIATAPCLNTDIQATLDCGTNSALVSWTPGNGALSVNVTLQSFQDSQLHSCFTYGSSCNISSLQCGQRYSISVTGNGQAGTSVSTPMATVDTAPCAPTQVNVSLAHGSDTASVSWAASSGFVSYYVVTAEYDNGRALTCNSSSTSCNISGLACSEAYNVSITAMSANCTGQRSEVRHINTALCAPKNVSANVSCSSNIATVTWGRSRKADIYSVTASSANGLSVNCTSASTSCDLMSLTCGESYTITVKAGGSNCSSTQSTPVQIQTAPCTPRNVLAVVDCFTNALAVSWTPSVGGQYYTATLQDSNGLSTSCQSTGSQCNITGLRCGQLYSINVTASDNLCSSVPSATVNTNSVPCTASSISAVLDCQLNTAIVSWQYGEGAQGYAVSALSLLGNRTGCMSNSSSTYCELNNLQCGTQYTVTVQTLGNTCNASAQMNSSLIIGTCVPQHLTVQYSPSNTRISWDASNGAAGFTAVAVTPEGLRVNCETNTSCILPVLNCGHIYNFSVTAHNGVCNSTAITDPIKTEPCPPQNVKASINCTALSATVSWDPSQFALGYVAFLDSGNGRSTSCQTNQTQCSLANLTCGTLYNVRVLAIGEVFNSSDSIGFNITSAPCPPLNIHSTMNFDNKTASVSWSPGNGALSFIMTMQCFPGQTYTCMTSQMTCDITNMTCGQACPVQVVAVGQSCNSSVQTGPPIATAPCLNTDIQATLDCGTNSALVSWTPGNGALSFNVTLQSFQDSQLHSCLTNGSSCNISSLQCGQRYSISVTGNGQAGTSVSTPMATVDTAPCAPTQVNVSLAHGSDTASVSWAASSGFVSYYVVTAEYDNGRALTCNSSSTSCNISGLACSEAYNVSITAMSANCTGQRSEVRHINTALCAPQNVSANVSCSSNIATVTWGRSRRADNYSVTASSASGLSINCTSASTSCDLLALTCGESYTITVKAGGSNCSSVQSTPVQIQTAPCPPLNIHSTMNFDNKTASVSWSPGNGALSFIMTMQCFPGQTYTCMTSQMTCDITNMTCGQACPVQVVAVGQSCNSSVQTGPPIATAPCLNTDIQATLDCGTNSALVSWTPGNGALSVNVTLQSFQDSQLHSCLTNGSSCNISSLQCGQRYSISVTGNGQAGTSVSTPSATVDTAPCAPTQVNVSLAHGSDTASVSWAASSGFVSYYVVTAEYDNGRALTCNSSSTSCNISGLACSEAYNVSITAMSANCTGQRSEVRHINTALCAPQNVSANVSCSSNIATVTWGRSRKADIYSVKASSANGLSVNCTSASTSCDLMALTCGESYTITAKAGGSNCSSTQSTPVQIQTAPCTPRNVLAVVDCFTNVLAVSWTPSVGGQYYTATLQDSNGLSTSCQSTGSQCNITGLRCGQLYSINVTASDNLCSSVPSATVNTNSVPCTASSISAVLDCQLNTAIVSWQYGEGAQGYVVSALSLLGNRTGCMSNSSSTYCELNNLQCGTQYTVTVQTLGNTCNASAQMNSSLIIGTCVPQHLTVQYSPSNTRISWDASNGAAGFTAVAVTPEGLRVNCETNTSCILPVLNCGHIYNFSVTAHNGVCNSTAITDPIKTEPCPPQNVKASINCTALSATVSWDPSQFALGYVAFLDSGNGRSTSCQTNQTQCSLDNLTCGTLYNVRVLAIGEVFNSSDSIGFNITSAPCASTSVSAVVDCATDSVLVSWSFVDGAVNYSVMAWGSGGQMVSCSTNQNYCNILSLQCGQRFNLTLTSINQQCQTTTNTNVIFQSSPCTPVHLQTYAECNNRVGSVSWGSSEGAIMYKATAVGRDRHQHLCTTTDTSCTWTDLHCGLIYTITVTANNNQCTSASSTSTIIHMAPCVPQMMATLDCTLNFVTVLWTVSRGATSYLVVASGPEGPVTACNTANQQCVLQTLLCSSSYDISVIAVNQQCNSSGSSISQINTVPCVPGHVQGSVNCTTGAVSLSWNQSKMAVSYSAVAQSSGGYTSVCNSIGTACVFSDLLCGMNYSLAVTASDGTCRTAPSQPILLTTVSCKPQNVSTQITCDTNSAIVTWELSDHVTHHTVQAVGTDGHHVNCSSSNNTCTLPALHCGQSYNVTVSALDGICDNSNTLLSLQSAPCAPSNVQTSLLCNMRNGGVLSVSWVQATGAVSYMAVAVSSDGHSYSCNSTTTSCNLQELQCGQIYSVSVFSLANGCGGVMSTVSQVQTAPCAPQNVQANVQCDTGSVLVSWSPSVDSSQFVVELVSQSTGVISFCNSTNTQCSITNLTCGQIFNLSVVAVRGSCQSQPSSGVNINSAPCIPQGVNGTVDCVTNSAWVSWDVDNSTDTYTVLAVGDNGQNSTCISSNSVCHVPDLGCGRRFTFQVTASNGACVSLPSKSFKLETAPCALSSIVAIAECQSSVIKVQWQREQMGDSLYTVTAEDQDRNFLSCNSSTSSCNLTNVQCGKEYTIIVEASAEKCSGLRSPPYKIRTVPCQPSTIQTHTDCQSKDVSVWWDKSYVAQSYLLTAVGRDGDLKTCNTSDSNCTLTNLHCSNTYYVSVTASNENCTSLPSTNVTFQTVPCQPSNLTANIECENGSASLYWVGSTGAVAYMGLGQSENSTTIYCETTQTFCSLTGLVCGAVYNFTVLSTDGTCNSSLSDPQTMGAAPCPPAQLSVAPRTVVNGTQILRASWSTVNCSKSEYLLALKGCIHGNHNAQSDLTSYWTVRTFFEIPLPCGSSYSATIRARNFAATSDESAAVNGTTVPCAPANVTFTASSAQVAWTKSVFATNYTVYGVTSSNRTTLCLTTQLLCSVSNFSSGNIVVTASNAAGESEDSVPVLISPSSRRR